MTEVVVPADLTSLPDADLLALSNALLRLAGGKGEDGWPLPHPDAIRVTEERNRRSRDEASAAWIRRTNDLQLRGIMSRRRPPA